MSDSAGDAPPERYRAFEGHRRIAVGPLALVAVAVKRARARDAKGPLLIWDDVAARVVDVDLRGRDRDVIDRLTTRPSDSAAPERRGRGRPRLGVVAREVTLLPRHWEWLAAQPGGASVALRRLVDAARRENAERDAGRAARDGAYRFMVAIGGDLPGFDEAARALFAGERERFVAVTARWPKHVRDDAAELAWGGRRSAAG